MYYLVDSGLDRQEKGKVLVESAEVDVPFPTGSMNGNKRQFRFDLAG